MPSLNRQTTVTSFVRRTEMINARTLVTDKSTVLFIVVIIWGFFPDNFQLLRKKTSWLEVEFSFTASFAAVSGRHIFQIHCCQINMADSFLILANFYLLRSRGNIILINIRLWIKHTKHFVTKWLVQQHDSGKKTKESLLLWLKLFLVFTKRECVKCAIVADAVVLSWIVITSWIVIAVVNFNNSCREM